MEWAVQWGLAHRDLSNVRSIGVDEVLWHRGHKYLTVVYQIDSECKRLLWVGKDRTIRTLLRVSSLSAGSTIGTIAFRLHRHVETLSQSDRQKASQAIHVLDRFHIAMHMNKAVDEVRAQETRNLKAKGLTPILTHSRWCLLKRPQNLTALRRSSFPICCVTTSRAIRSYLLKEDFQFFWDYVSPHWAGKFLDLWCTRAMRSRIEPMKKVARMLR